MTDADARAEVLDLPALKARPVPQIPTAESLSVEAGLSIQTPLAAHRIARGQRPVVLKLGLTGAAQTRQVGVTEVIPGRLTDAMQHGASGSIDLGALIHPLHPQVRPEIPNLLR